MVNWLVGMGYYFLHLKATSKFEFVSFFFFERLGLAFGRWKEKSKIRIKELGGNTRIMEYYQQIYNRHLLVDG